MPSSAAYHVCEHEQTSCGNISELVIGANSLEELHDGKNFEWAFEELRPE